MASYDPSTWQILLSISLGLGLAAACGFRIFVPMLAASAAALGGYLEVTGNFAWIGTWPAFMVFAAATLLEVLAYFVPWVDNLLDGIGAPAAVVAGTLVAASSFVGLDPWLHWIVAAIAGGGAAGAVHGVMSLVRGGSTATTGGLANPLVALVELVGAVLLSLASILLPIVGLAAGVFCLVLLVIWLRRRERSAEPALS